VASGRGDAAADALERGDLGCTVAADVAAVNLVGPGTLGDQ
jgi:hypothetical protein